MRNFFNRLFAVLLLSAFSIFLVPNELVHALYGHEDTHETSSANGIETIGTQHIHCDFLSYESPVYTSSSIASCPVSVSHVFAFMAIAPENAGIVFSFSPSPRGPPALV